MCTPTSPSPLLSAQPPPQLLLLDEPTNNLDLASVRKLGQAFAGYRGALVVASHDLPFLSAIGITRWLRMDRTDGLREADSQMSARPTGGLPWRATVCR